MGHSQLLLSVEDLIIHYQSRKSTLFTKPEIVSAVRGVTFSINSGETLAIVGESGCGKTSIVMSILGFVKPVSGKIKYKGTDIWDVTREELRGIRRKIQPVFQDPHHSLNPRMTVGQAIEDGLWPHQYEDMIEKQNGVLELLRAVRLGKEHLNTYPHQLSGGQKQRVCIARALAPNPELLILDEPLSSQDLSIQATLVNLLLDLKQKKGLTYLFISHDLRIVRSIAQQVAVMRDGILVEVSDRDSIFNNPQHSYTESLLKSSGLL
ncbi:MAG: ABC transporter ATP-binding protein [Candidatus Marinimicrobia bacterium]|nr:ABC transporter ATP-binding protein [Candidatus Neomarinimicrobiota bacterium]MCH7763098.1 ABC transporter ATP-binding protein [Candidatus Neomarinimicrobiota bacterium]